MANRTFNQFTSTLEKKVVNLYLNVAIGASGAPTISNDNSKGIKSIVRNSTGKYTITLSDPYYKFLNFIPQVLLASGLPAVQENAVVSQAVNTASGPTIVVQFSAAGVAAEIDSGATLFATIVLGNSSAF